MQRHLLHFALLLQNGNNYITRRLQHCTANIIKNYALKQQLLPAFFMNSFVSGVNKSDVLVMNIN